MGGGVHPVVPILIRKSPEGKGAAWFVLESFVVTVKQNPSILLTGIPLSIVRNALQKTLRTVGRGFWIVSRVHVVDVQFDPATMIPVHLRYCHYDFEYQWLYAYAK